MSGNLIKKSDLRDVERAIAALERIETRQGEEWHDYEFDALSSARAAMVDWVEEHSE